MVPPDAVVPPTMDRRYLEQQELQEQMDQLKRQGETWILDDFGADEPSETN
jgi:EAL domain-containing protein (putative c-di-GMP-specific phosphodiesterase class I)